jgi:glutaredoxin
MSERVCPHCEFLKVFDEMNGAGIETNIVLRGMTDAMAEIVSYVNGGTTAQAELIEVITDRLKVVAGQEYAERLKEGRVSHHTPGRC